MQSINFEFLRPNNPQLADLGGFAEAYAFSDPAGCLVKLRMFAETLTRGVFSHYRLELAYQGNFNDLLHDSSFKAITPPVVQDKLHLLRIKGNHAAHGTLHDYSTDDIVGFLKEGFDLACWFSLSVDGRKRDNLPVWTRPTQETTDPTHELRRKNRSAQKKLAEQEALMAKLLDDLEKTRARAEAAQKSDEEKQLLLKHAQQAANALDFSEAETRRKLIDEQIRAAGWKVGLNGANSSEVGQEVPIGDQPTPSRRGKVDYVLYGENGQPLALIEAKKTAEDAEKGRMQARYYADALEKQHGQRPLIFCTNGFDIVVWDDRKGEPPRPLFGFYSRDSLEYAHFQTRERKEPLGALNPHDRIVDRMYQFEAIKRVAETFDKRRRKALVIQATGTGKTRVAIALCELMIRANWAKRILFLCDRRELRKQASDVFDEYLPSEPKVVVTSQTGSDRNKRIYLATYPAMMKCFHNFDVGFFDLIIADESHRSIYNRYRDLFRYFDAFQVGLTATPVEFVFRNTYRLFECEDRNPTFNYTYEEAITHSPPYLCPFRVVKHTTKFLRQGIKYREMSENEREELEDQVDDSEAVDYEREEVSRKVFNRDTDRQILRNLMENGVRDADGIRLGKTIVFARNHRHARLLIDLFNEMHPQYGGDFCVRIDHYEPRADQLIDDFKSRESNLTIAVSVDMLDTGIDVPEVVNLVFAKPVRSYVKFWQMIGRGTRRCPDLFGPGKHKEYFQIFDHWGNFEYFDEAPDEKEPSRSVSLQEQVFRSRIELAETARDKEDADSLGIAVRLVEADIAALPEKCLSVREKWREIKAVQKDGVLERFDPATVASLRREISGLMQWREIAGHEAAFRFDLLMARLETARLNGSSAAEDLRDTVIEQLSDLPENLAPVQEKLPVIRLARDPSFYESASTQDLEKIRIELRGIMRYRRRETPPPQESLVLNVSEDPEQFRTETHNTRLKNLDLAHYRNRVEGTLHSLIDTSSILQKIRAGEAVSEDDIEELTREVLVHDPDLKLDDLLVHFPNKSQSLILAIRRIVGMDAEKVNEHFTAFVRKYPEFNANQIRFLELLKSQIARYGAIELEKLWEEPFTSIHTEGVDGVFQDSQQVDELLDLLKKLNNPAA